MQRCFYCINPFILLISSSLYWQNPNRNHAREFDFRSGVWLPELLKMFPYGYLESVKRFERSNGLDTALYKTMPFLERS